MTNKIKFSLLSASAALLLAACGNGSAPAEDSTANEPASQETTQVEETTADQADDTNESDDQSDDVNESDDQSDDTTDQASADSQDSEAADPTTPQGIEGEPFAQTFDNALAVFYQEVGTEDVQFESIELDDEDNQTWIYEIQAYVGNAEYDVDIDAQTNDVLAVEFEEDDYDGDEVFTIDQVTITPEQAMATALETSDTAYVRGWELEIEDGRIEYEVDLEGAEDVTIDATNGQIID